MSSVERSVVSARHFSYNDFHQRPRGREKSRWSRRAAAPASTSAHLGPARAPGPRAPPVGRLLTNTIRAHLAEVRNFTIYDLKGQQRLAGRDHPEASHLGPTVPVCTGTMLTYVVTVQSCYHSCDHSLCVRYNLDCVITRFSLNQGVVRYIHRRRDGSHARCWAFCSVAGDSFFSRRCHAARATHRPRSLPRGPRRSSSTTRKRKLGPAPMRSTSGQSTSRSSRRRVRPLNTIRSCRPSGMERANRTRASTRRAPV